MLAKSKNKDAPSWRLHTAKEIDEIRPDFESLASIVGWLKVFVARPHPSLGRTGPVCPVVPIALAEDTIWLTVVRGESFDRFTIEQSLIQFRDLFLSLEPTTGEQALHKTIVLIFPDLPAQNAPTLIDEVHKALKPIFVGAGLMLGEFHNANVSPGLHNPEFHPLRSPIPLLVIRYMVEADLVFLMREIDTPEARVGFLEAYLRRFHNMLPAARLSRATAALAEAKSEISMKEKKLAYA